MISVKVHKCCWAEALRELCYKQRGYFCSENKQTLYHLHRMHLNQHIFFHKWYLVANICRTLPLEWAQKKAISTTMHVHMCSRFFSPSSPSFFCILMRASLYADQLFLLEPIIQHKKVDLWDRQQIESHEALNSASRITGYHHCHHHHCCYTWEGNKSCSHTRGCCSGDLLWQDHPAIRRWQ